MTFRQVTKKIIQAIALAMVFPSAFLSWFGRVLPVYTFFAHLYALGPGLPGGYLRSAYYRLTLQESSMNTTIGPGTIFVHPSASIGKGVSVGCYCVIGRVLVGQWTQIASHVEIPSGRKQHDRDEAGMMVGSYDEQLTIGAYCWIGASAVVLANVGDNSTIGAGAVVVKDIPPGSTAVGNPARVIRTAGAQVV